MKSLLYHYRHIWDVASTKLGKPQHNDYTTIWHKKDLTEFLHIQGSELWEAQGVYYLHHLLSDGKLKTYNMLNEEFSLHNHMLFF